MPFNLLSAKCFKIRCIFVIEKILSMALLSFKWLLPALVSFFHPFYVSVTEINHNAAEKTLEVSCKVFADDLEEVLKKNYNVSVDLSNNAQQAQNNKYVIDYFQKHLAVTADGKAAKLAYLGYEKDQESVYCYFEVANMTSLKKVELTNSILQDLNEKQINIMHVVVGGNRKSYKLDFPEKKATFIF